MRLTVVGHRRSWEFPFVEPIDETDPPELPLSTQEKLWLAADYAVLQLFHAVVVASFISTVVVGAIVVLVIIL